MILFLNKTELTPSQEISDESDDESQEAEVNNSIKTYIEAMSTVQSLNLFSEDQGDDKALAILSNLEIHFQEVVLKKKTRQTTLHDFFK